MGQNISSTTPENNGESQSRIRVWISALTRPTVQNFEDLVRDPNATSKKAYIWIFWSTLLAFSFQSALSGMFGLSAPNGSDVGATPGSSYVTLICVAPFFSLLSVLGLMISAGLTQLIASALGGTGTYSKLVYAFAAYSAPLAIISSIVGSIPYVNCLAFPLAIYGMVLNVIAVKAVNQFGWGKAIASSWLIFASILLVTVLVALMVIAILTLLGPTIGTVFSGIIQGLETPVP